MSESLDPYTGTFSRVRTAHVEHDCVLGRGCVIHPGERYLDSVMPPWVMIQDDPESRPFANGEWSRSRYHVDGHHNEDGMIDLYHRTTPEAKAEILRTRVWRSFERGFVYFSNRPDPQSQAAGYGDALIHIRIPRTWAELDDEFPDGEKHYRVSRVRAAHNIVEG